MKKGSMWLLLVLGLWTFQACNSSSKETDSKERAEEINEDKAGVDEDDAEFAVKAANGGLLEVELGRIALEKATNPKVKDFASMMTKDHTKANDELKALAASKNITLPSTLGEEAQKHVDELSKLSGAEFDKEYVKLMVDDHKEDVDSFEEASKNAKDAEIKSFAATTLPTLKSHLEAIKAINQNM